MLADRHSKLLEGMRLFDQARFELVQSPREILPGLAPSGRIPRNLRKLVSQIALLSCVLIGTAVHARQWIVCDAQIKVTEHGEKHLSAKIVHTSPANPSSCFKPGEALQFEPETADYQQMLARKAWPKPGQLAKLRYRELKGFCKGDGVTTPCTIRHYSIIK